MFFRSDYIDNPYLGDTDIRVLILGTKKSDTTYI